jgi:hypothetical protein
MRWVDSNNSQLPTPNFQYHAAQMNDSDLRTRLDALVAALAPPALPAVASAKAGALAKAGVDAVPDDLSGADAQRIATMQIDELMRRISTLTGILGGLDGRGWDEVDQLAAQLLIADLTAVTSTTRALNDLAASRLAGALADLQAAGVDVQRAVTEASGS